MAANWCDMPMELLDLIAQNFDIPSDTVHFRSVCDSWRWAIPRPESHSVQLVVGPMIFQSNNLGNPNFCLTKQTFSHLSDGLVGGWLIKTEEHKPEVFHLYNPFSTSSVKINDRNSNSTALLNISNVQIRELGHEYVLRGACENNADIHNMENEKVAFKSLSNNNFAILTTHNTGKLLFYGEFGEWAFLDDSTLGYDERSMFVNDWSLHYVDVVEHQGTFYAVTNSGRTVSIKLNDDSSMTVKLLTKSIIGGDKKCLVKSGDDLLMVDLYTCPTPSGVVNVHAVEIYKLKNDEKRWVLVKGLDGRALFLSNRSAFSVTEGVQGCKGNAIYFHLKNNWDYNKDEVMKKEEMELKSEEIGVFDYEKGIVGKLNEYLEDSLLFSWPPPQWITLA